jgi:hypothetical protein
MTISAISVVVSAAALRTATATGPAMAAATPATAGPAPADASRVARPSKVRARGADETRVRGGLLRLAVAVGAVTIAVIALGAPNATAASTRGNAGPPVVQPALQPPPSRSTSGGSTAVPVTSWTFTVSAFVPPSMVVKYGGMTALTTLVQNQIATVSSRFTTSLAPSTFHFNLASVAEYTTTAAAQVATQHPGSDLQIVYEENPTDQGGWFGSYQTILHNWTYQNQGDFAPFATDGLVHEFGHFRGTVDEYAENVTAASNPVSGTAFTAPPGIMTYPYGVNSWSAYSADIIRASAQSLYSGAPIVDKSFPATFRVRAVNSAGKPVVGVKVALFGVTWFSNAVNAVPAVQGSTTSVGYFQLPRNPFAPGTASTPWNLAYSNFLVRLTSGTTVKYRWMPLTTVGAAYLTAPSHPFTITFRVP